MKSDSTTVIKNMEFLVKELHKEWDRSGASKASVIISLEEVDGIPYYPSCYKGYHLSWVPFSVGTGEE